MADALPLAAGLDWLEGILPLLFLLFWLVSQVRNLFRGADRGKAPGPVVVRPAPRPPAGGDPRDDLREDLARQIEEFVRRSSGERQPASRAAPPLPPPLPPARARPQRSAAPTPRPRREPAAPAAAPPTLGSLGGHAADVSRHVRDAFAHEIDHLPAGLAGAGATAAAVHAARPPVVDVVAALRDPATLRQLVIVREVLERPVDRW